MIAQLILITRPIRIVLEKNAKNYWSRQNKLM